MNDNIKKEFANTYVKENVIKNVYNKLITFDEYENQMKQDMCYIDTTDLLKWYINNASKFSFNSIKPIKSYIEHYKQWRVQNDSSINKNMVSYKYNKNEIIKVIIQQNKNMLIRSINELVDILIESLPIADQDELDVNTGVQLVYILQFLGFTDEEIYNISINDVYTNYTSANIIYNNKSIEINNPHIINLLVKCKNVRKFKQIIKKKKSSTSIICEELDNDYLINVNVRLQRTIQTIKKITYSRNAKSLGQGIYLANVRKYGKIAKIKEFELNNNLEIITDINDTTKFFKLYNKVFPFKNNLERNKFSESKLRDLFCIYLAW